MKVTILGCGVYGLALAHSFLENKAVSVRMWSKFAEEALTLGKKYPKLTFSNNLKEVSEKADLIVIAIPVAFLESVIAELKSCYQGQDILIASKGMDIEKQRFAYSIVLDNLEDAKVGVISGGTFAQDMMDKKVMGLTLGTNSFSIQEKVKTALNIPFLKLQFCEDLIGVSVCGAIKNVFAIGAGILDGAGFPPSSRFLFLTESFYEVKDFIKELGGDAKVVMSYAGIDDMMMTCTSVESRNYTFGKMIGEAKSRTELELYQQTTTIEGLGTSKGIYLFCQKKKITLPLTFLIYQILYEGKDISALIEYLENKDR